MRTEMRTEQIKSYCSLPEGRVGSFACQLQFNNELKRRIVEMQRLLMLGFVLIMAIVLLSACTGSGDRGPTDAANGVPEGWKTLSYEGISVSCPAEWEITGPETGIIVAIVAQRLPGDPTGLRLDLAPGEGPRIAQMDAGVLKKRLESSLYNIHNQEISIEAFEKKEINGKEGITAVLIDKRFNSKLKYYALVRHGDNAVIVSCSCFEEDRDTWEETFKQIIASIAVSGSDNPDQDGSDQDNPDQSDGGSLSGAHDADKYASVLDDCRTYADDFHALRQDRSDEKDKKRENFYKKWRDTPFKCANGLGGVLQNRMSDNAEFEFGYGMKDINGDGIPDLFLMSRSTGTDKGFINVHAIFSLCKGEPTLLYEFTYYNFCRLIAEDGTIYHDVDNEGNPRNDYRVSMRITAGGGSMTAIESVHRQFSSDERKSGTERFEKSSNGRFRGEISEEEITSEEGKALWDRLDVKSPKNVAPGIEFIPLFLE
jgi:hypothetical protein